MKTENKLQDTKINVKIKLATLWTSFMFLYIYVDYFHLYMPNTLVEIQKGIVFKFTITQTFLLTALISVSIPLIMIFLSTSLPAKLNRSLNIVIALLYIPYSLFNLVGEVWMQMIYGAVIEIIILLLIIKNAWKWPREV